MSAAPQTPFRPSRRAPAAAPPRHALRDRAARRGLGPGGGRGRRRRALRGEVPRRRAGGRALAAELIVGELARAAGLRIPELAFIEIDTALGRSEPHREIQELLIASAGLNLAMGYLSGAVSYDVAAGDRSTARWRRGLSRSIFSRSTSIARRATRTCSGTAGSSG